MRCDKCRFWGNGDGTGHSYDAGHVNECKHPLITGYQHASSAAVRDDQISKVIVDDGNEFHRITTRWNFGCVLFVSNGKGK